MAASAGQPSTKDRLISSAVDLIVEHGSIDVVSMRSIAKRAGVSPTAVYRHYADFDHLIAATVAWAWSQFDEAVNRASEPVEDPFERLHASGMDYLRFAEAQPGVYRVLFSVRDVAAGLRRQYGGPVFDTLVARVAAALEVSGDDREPYVVAASLFAWIHGVADLSLSGVELGATSVDEQLRSMLADLRLCRPH